MSPLHRSVVLGAALVAALGSTGACASSGSGGGSNTSWLTCAVDTDCPAPRLCVAERCVEGASPRTSGGAGGSTASGGTAANGGALGNDGAIASGGVTGAGGGAPGAGGTAVDSATSTGGTDTGSSAGGADASLHGGAPADAGAASDASLTDANETDASSGAAYLDGGVPVARSCLTSGDGVTNCGVAEENCCTSLTVPGGTFFRTYTNDGTGPVGEADPATISTFRLDKYDVTLGRFRRFVDAWKTGWRPAAGSGKHTYLPGGRGLSDQANASGFEPGWVTTDDSNVVLTDAALTCPNLPAVWSPSPGAYETRPMSCVNWWEAYAFCIWDGGFLPSEAEWEYAAAGGSEQRQYTWGSTPPGTQNQYAIFDCQYGPYDAGNRCPYAINAENIAPVGSAPLGAGKFGQLDLIGNVMVWMLDKPMPGVFDTTRPNPCSDCTYLPDVGSGNGTGLITGGMFGANGLPLSPWIRIYVDASRPAEDIGFRCARAPE